MEERYVDRQTNGHKGRKEGRNKDRQERKKGRIEGRQKRKAVVEVYRRKGTHMKGIK